MRTKRGNGHDINIEQFLADLKTVVQDGEELLKAGVTGMKQRAVAGAQSTDRLVRSHPYQTLGIIFGIGLLAGLLFSGMLGREEELESERASLDA